MALAVAAVGLVLVIVTEVVGRVLFVVLYVISSKGST